MAEPSDVVWLADQIASIPHSHEVMTPSEWAEKRRYLPPSVSMMPGPYRFARAPYLREIVDCLSVDSPIREVAVMKGVQVGATTGVLENAIGYSIEHVQTSPMMLVTADRELAALRLESNVLTMIELSELSQLIRSSDQANSRKTGSTSKKVEWIGGGYILPLGANSANKMRQQSIEWMLRDEIDGWPDVVGKQGDPIELTFGRTKGYEATRKIVDLSTPLLKGTSKIEPRFLRGDQRHYIVLCFRCGFPQALSGYSGAHKWRSTSPQTGEVTGVTWETQDGRLVPDSVRYCCHSCGHAHYEHDKPMLLSPENGAAWQPTATPVNATVRSYHLGALYSLVQSWAQDVEDYLAAWDDQQGRVKDMGKLQVFYNNILGLTFHVQGDGVSFERASAHRRPEYMMGQVPNRFAVSATGSPISILTMAVDVHADNLAVAVIGWTRGGRAFLVDYWRLEGDTDNLDDAGTWTALDEIICGKRYESDDGKTYGIAITLVDSRYRSDHVYNFCTRWEVGVYPCGGKEETRRSEANKNFAPYANNPMGLVAYSITVDRYKDRWAPALRRTWNGVDEQPEHFFNAPLDTTDAQLKELTVEYRREKVQKETGKRLGWEWYRPSGSRNELWDLLVYNSAALDIAAWDIFRNQLGLDDVNWPDFWDHAEEGAYLVSE